VEVFPAPTYAFDPQVVSAANGVDDGNLFGSGLKQGWHQAVDEDENILVRKKAFSAQMSESTGHPNLPASL
jgi:bacillopeptidase F (M6 metalloprotease family)